MEPSIRFSNVSLFFLSASSMSSSSLHTGSEPHVYIKSFSINSSSVSLLALEFLQYPYLETLHTPPFLSYPQSLPWYSLIGSAVNPVKSCTTCGQFSPAGIYCSGFDGFFYNNYGIIKVYTYVNFMQLWFNTVYLGAPGWLSELSVQLQLRSWSCGLWVRARVRLCADSSEPGACFGFCVYLSLCPSPVRAPSLCQK